MRLWTHAPGTTYRDLAEQRDRPWRMGSLAASQAYSHTRGREVGIASDEIDCRAGDALYDSGKYAEAIAAYDQSIAGSKYSVRVRALINKGSALNALGRWSETLDSNHKEGRSQRSYIIDNNECVALIGLGLYDTALKWFDEVVIPKYARSEELQNDIAHSPTSAGPNIIYPPSLKQLGYRDEPSGVLFNNKGALLIKMGRYAEALSLIDLGIERYKPNSALANNKGIALTELGSYQDAWVVLSQAVAMNPNFGTSYANLADVLIRAGRYAEAVVYINQAIRLGPDARSLEQSYIVKTDELVMRGRYDEALGLLKKGIKLYSASRTALHHKIRALYGYLGDNRTLAKYDTAMYKRGELDSTCFMLPIARH